LVILYAGLVVGIFVFQRRLLFFPERYAPAAARSRAAEAGLVLWSAGATEYSGFLAEPRGTAAKGTVVVFHGNAGDASARAYYAAALVPRGFRVLLAEYPAYGARSGRLGESPLVADGVTTVRHVRQVFGQPTIVLGESVGAGVAAAVAGVLGTNGVDGLVLVTPWDSLTHLAQRRYWFLPVRLLLRDRFDNIAHANAYGGPVAVVVAEDDRIVPRCHADALYGALRVPKRRWVLPNCGHNDWPADADSRWWDEVMAFVRK
jgi:pimeloyl-ACP methyl ester carboxylesterase